MVTYYTEQDLVKFGQYLLSKERTERILSVTSSSIPDEDRLSLIYHSDIENFKELIKND